MSYRAPAGRASLLCQTIMVEASELVAAPLVNVFWGDTPVLAGGYRIESPFGTFIAPNISPSPQGIGGWSAQDLADALIAADDDARGAPLVPAGS